MENSFTDLTSTPEQQETFRRGAIMSTDNSFDFYDHDVDRHTRMIVFGMINEAFKHDINTMAFAKAINNVQKTVLKLNGFEPDEIDDANNIFTIH